AVHRHQQRVEVHDRGREEGHRFARPHRGGSREILNRCGHFAVGLQRNSRESASFRSFSTSFAPFSTRFRGVLTTAFCVFPEKTELLDRSPPPVFCGVQESLNFVAFASFKPV